jgi:hypothetical protein
VAHETGLDSRSYPIRTFPVPHVHALGLYTLPVVLIVNAARSATVNAVPVTVAVRTLVTSGRSMMLVPPLPLSVSSAYRGANAHPHALSISISTVVRISTTCAVVNCPAVSRAWSSATPNRNPPTTSTYDVSVPFRVLVHVTVSRSRVAVCVVVRLYVLAAVPVPVVAAPAATRTVPSQRVIPTVTVPGSTAAPSSYHCWLRVPGVSLRTRSRSGIG